MVALVVSYGSFVLAGIAGGDAFRAVFPSLVDRPRVLGIRAGMEFCILLGDYFWKMCRILRNVWFDIGFNFCGSLRRFIAPRTWQSLVRCWMLLMSARKCGSRMWMQVWRQFSELLKKLSGSTADSCSCV